MDDYIGTIEAAKLLGIHRVTLYKRIKAGLIPHYRLDGGREEYRFDRAELLEYRASRLRRVPSKAVSHE